MADSSTDTGPDYSKITLADIMEQVSTFKSGVEDATRKLVGVSGQQQGLANDSAQINVDAGMDNAVVVAARNAATLSTQARVAKAGEAFRSNLDLQNEQITGLIAEQDTAYANKVMALKEIERKDSVGLMDDPIEYFMNMLTVNTDIRKANISEEMEKGAKAKLDAVLSQTTAAVQVQKLFDTPLTVAAAEASNRNASREGMLAANAAKIEGLKYNAQGIQAVLAMDKDKLHAMQIGYSATNAAANLALAQQEAARRAAEFREKMNDKASAEEAGESYIAKINIGRQARGIAPLDDITAKIALRAIMGKGGVINAEMQQDLQSGERTSMLGVNSIASSPAELLSRFKAGQAINLTIQQAPIKEVAIAAASIVASAANDPSVAASYGLKNFDPKNKDQLAAALSSVTQQLLSSQARNIKSGDENNIYQIGSLAAIAAGSPAVASLPVFQKVLKPLADKGVPLTNHEQIFSMVGAAVSSGQITHAQATELATVYQAGTEINRLVRNVEGVAGLTWEKGFRTQVTTSPGAMFKSKEVIDFTNPQQLSRALLRSQAAVLSGQMTAVRDAVFSSVLPSVNAGLVGAKLIRPLLQPTGQPVIGPASEAASMKSPPTINDLYGNK